MEFAFVEGLYEPGWKDAVRERQNRSAHRRAVFGYVGAMYRGSPGIAFARARFKAVSVAEIAPPDLGAIATGFVARP